MNDPKVYTIHEIRSMLESAEKFAESINAQYSKGEILDSYSIRSVYQFLHTVNSSKWTIETF